jgi:hypothetical protein
VMPAIQPAMLSTRALGWALTHRRRRRRAYFKRGVQRHRGNPGNDQRAWAQVPEPVAAGRWPAPGSGQAGPTW